LVLLVLAIQTCSRMIAIGLAAQARPRGLWNVVGTFETLALSHETPGCSADREVLKWNPDPEAGKMEPQSHRPKSH